MNEKRKQWEKRRGKEGETGGELVQREEADGGKGGRERERKIMNMSHEGTEEGRWAQMEGDEWKCRVMEKVGEEDGMST